MFVTGQITYPTSLVKRPRIWRVLHELELDPKYRRTPLGQPEMRTLFPNHFSDFGREAQLLSRAMNPRISDDKWTQVYHDTLWITNRQGFGNEDDPRNNYVTGKNLNQDYEDPKVECLTTGGSILTGFETTNYLAVETIDYTQIPTLEWIMARPWFWTYAVSMDSHLKPRRFPQGLQPNGEIVPIIHPLIGDPKQYELIVIPKWSVVEWTKEELPDPYTVYLPYS